LVISKPPLILSVPATKRTARMVKSIIESGSARACRPRTFGLPRAELASGLLRSADAAALDTAAAAVSILAEDDQIDQEFDGLFAS
jgi:phosphate transport system protein